MAAEFAYDYNNDINFNININTAPVLEPNREQKKKPQQRPLRKLNKRQSKREMELRTYAKAAKVFVIVSIALALGGIFCNSAVARNTSRIELQRAQRELAIYCDEKIVLQNKLSKLVSANNIDKIAVEKLGLVKVASANEIYFDTEKTNEVLFSQGN